MAQTPINASAIPVPTLDPFEVGYQAGLMKTAAGQIRTGGSAVKTAWAGLSSSYSAPEAATLFAAMDPVATATDAFAGDGEQVAAALSSFSDTAAKLQGQLNSLQIQAYQFEDKVSGNDKWDHDSSLVNQNNSLVTQVNTAICAYQAAERDCANTIEALFGGKTWHALKAGEDPNKDPWGYGYNSIPGNAKTPWGAKVQKKDGCVKQALKDTWHFVEGVGIGAWNMVKGVGTLVWNLTGAGGWQNFKSSWNGMFFLTTMLTPGIGPLVGAAVYGPKKYEQMTVAMAKGLVNWDEWKKDPSKAAGETFTNVVTIFIPGADAADGISAGAKGAEAASDASKVADAADAAGDASTAAKVLNGAKDGLQMFAKYTDPFTYAGKLADLTKISDLANVLKLKIGDLTGLTKLDHDMSLWTHDGSTITHDGSTISHDGTTAGEHVTSHEPAHVGSGDHAGSGAGEHSGSGAGDHGGSGGYGGTGDHGGASEHNGSGTSDHGGTSGGDHGGTSDHNGSGSGEHGGSGSDDRGTNGDGAGSPPPVHKTIHVENPGARTAFTKSTGLEPDTAYVVEGRGTFYTNEHGVVTYVETSSGHTGALNPDLISPNPNTTYVVDHGYVYHTDGLGRTDHVHVDELGLHDADRSPSIQTRIGKEGGAGYDGGHLIARMFGGGPEDYNLVAMTRELNRASGGAETNFYSLEMHWKSLLHEDPPPRISVDIDPVYTDGGKVPTSIDVAYSVDDGPIVKETFSNVS